MQPAEPAPPSELARGMEDTNGADGARRVDPLAFSHVPHGWYYVGPLEGLRTPTEVTLGERCFVAFVHARRASVLDGRCSHFGARLARGAIVDGCLQCPMHGWRFRPDGTCASVPMGEHPPTTAHIASYPTAQVGGHLFFHTDRTHSKPMPFFGDESEDDLISAPPFAFDVNIPWWLASANGFDGQHFLAAHDRRMVGMPELVRCDAEFEARATFDVLGGAWRDRLTRLVAGPRVEMHVRSVGGSLVFVTSRARRHVTYGLVSIRPKTPNSAQVITIVWTRARLGAWRAFDALDVYVRSRFIRAFLEPDIVASDGLTYHPSRAIGADALLSRYLTWLSERDRGARRTDNGRAARTEEVPVSNEL